MTRKFVPVRPPTLIRTFCPTGSESRNSCLATLSPSTTTLERPSTWVFEIQSPSATVVLRTLAYTSVTPVTRELTFWPLASIWAPVPNSGAVATTFAKVAMASESSRVSVAALPALLRTP